MKKKSYANHITVYLVLSIVLTIFVYTLVEWHRDMPARVQEQRLGLLGASANANTVSLSDRIKPVGQVHMERTEPESVASAPAAARPATAAKRDGQQVYQATCVACHGPGIAGAPKVGDKGQWNKRVAKGRNKLYTSAIKGMQSAAGVMPPKGGNLDLSDAEVKAAVDYMLTQLK